MAVAAAEFPVSPVMKKGPFGLVERVAGNVDVAAVGFLRKVARVAGNQESRGPKAAPALERIVFDDFARHVVHQGRIGDSDVAQLESDLFMPVLGRVNEIAAAVAFGVIVLEEQKRQEKERQAKEKVWRRSGSKGQFPNYEKRAGKVVADTLTVIPPRVAAAMLMSVSDPSRAQRIMHNEIANRTLRQIGFDLRPYAVAGFVLADRATRKEVFEQMVDLSPGPNGDAEKFRLWLTQSWPQRTHEYSGIAQIRTYIDGPAQRDAKIKEVQEDLGPDGILVQLGNGMTITSQ